jgi:cation:H+ antiporter
VDLARAFGVSDLMIGLTVVGIGTSLPELAAAIASAKRGQSEMIIGNIVGSNFFNTLAVVGIAGSITPFVGAGEWVFKRDLPFVILSTLMLICFSVNFKKRSEGGCINRFEAALMLLVYAVYFAIVIWQETNAAAVAAN